MRRLLARCAVAALAVLGSVSVAGCGSGGAGSEAGAVTVRNEPASTSSITRLDFAFLFIAGIPDRIETVDLSPGESQGFDLTDAEASNLFTLTVHWADATTTTYPLFGVSGGSTIGVSH